MVAAAALGFYLDRAPGSVRTRAVRSCGVTAVLGATAWTAALYVHGKERLDDDSRQVRGFAPWPLTVTGELPGVLLGNTSHRVDV